MNIVPLVTGPFQQNCYLVWKNPAETLIFDPGDDADLLQAALDEKSLTVSAYVCTHGHADHITALADLYSAHPAPVAMHSMDWNWAFGPRNRIEPYYSVPSRPETDTYLPLETKQDWQLAGLSFQCIETPGHTPGSCCLLFPDDGILIAGDTLFKGSCGRTDLPGGDPGKMKASLNKLKQLPDGIRVYPGHGSDTTIGVERLTNPYMQ
jgi:glyoxylase-like metal-dependent hydrolase (beta-lactamase superfamily II)